MALHIASTFDAAIGPKRQAEADAASQAALFGLEFITRDILRDASDDDGNDDANESRERLQRLSIEEVNPRSVDESLMDLTGSIWLPERPEASITPPSSNSIAEESVPQPAAAAMSSKGKFTIDPTSRSSVKTRNVYIACLPLDITDDGLRAIAAKFGNALSCRTFNSGCPVEQTGKAYGFVLYERPEEAEAAVTTLNGSEMAGGRLQAKISRNCVIRKARERHSGNRRVGGERDGAWLASSPASAQTTPIHAASSVSPQTVMMNRAATVEPSRLPSGLPPPYQPPVQIVYVPQYALPAPHAYGAPNFASAPPPPTALPFYHPATSFAPAYHGGYPC